MELVVRQPASEAEVEGFCRLAWSIFHAQDAREAYPLWRDRYIRAPGFSACQMIGVYLDGEHVGGCLLHRRTLVLGPSSLLTGCVGAVHVLPDQRGRGIAAAVLREAERQAIARRFALLLLSGIPDLYHRFGYADVFDPTIHAISRLDALAARGGEEYAVRSANPDDAADVLALYERHFPRLGRFERDLLKQRHLIGRLRPDRALRLAIDSRGAVRGYLQPSLHDAAVSPRAVEVAADDWVATATLLREHARLAGDVSEPPAELLWPLPIGSLACELLADHLPLRSERRSRPNQGWMARIANGQAFSESILPVLRDRWIRVAPRKPAAMRGARAHADSNLLSNFFSNLLQVDIRFGDGPEDALHYQFDEVGITLRPLDELAGHADAALVRLPASVLLPLLFGYRSVEWGVAQPGADVPPVLRPVLEVLFPSEPFWIPGTDSF